MCYSMWQQADLGIPPSAARLPGGSRDLRDCERRLFPHNEGQDPSPGFEPTIPIITIAVAQAPGQPSTVEAKPPLTRLDLAEHPGACLTWKADAARWAGPALGGELLLALRPRHTSWTQFTWDDAHLVQTLGGCPTCNWHPHPILFHHLYFYSVFVLK